MIDFSMAGDNLVVVGLATLGRPLALRRRALFWGIGAAALLRILFALFAVQLMNIVGLLFAGGLLLLWVSWKFWRQLRTGVAEAEAQPASPPKKLSQAILQIVIADVSMSLDNVLGVAGAARKEAWILVLGLSLSVLMMGILASAIAKLLDRHKWIGYVGLAVILYVALGMIWDGTREITQIAAAANLYL